MTETQKFAMQHALEALEQAIDFAPGRLERKCEKAIAALRQVIEDSPTIESVGETSSMAAPGGITVACFSASNVPAGVKLYTHPQPKQQPLTEDAIYEMWNHKFRTWIGGEQFEVVVKAVERAHGVGKEQ